MRFENPNMLWLLALVVPVLAGFLYWAWRKKQKLMVQFVNAKLLPNLTAAVSTTRQKVRLVLLVASVACVLLAAARPQYGFGWEEATQKSLDIVVAIDTSRSMLAEDIRPNRLLRAKLAAIDLMKLCKNDRLGLVAFAGGAFLQCPLTLDEEAFRQSVDALEVGIIPQGGTAIAEAIQVALSTFKEATDNHKVMVLFTDGEDHEAGLTEAMKKAEEAGLKIFTIGVGTAEGEFLRSPGDQTGQNYQRDTEGNIIRSKLNERMLQQLAGATGGFYLNLRSPTTVDMLYERGLAPLPRTEVASKLVRRYYERFYWPLALAIAFLLIEMFLSDRKPAANGKAAATPRKRVMAAAASLALCVPLAMQASPSSALQQYSEGKYGEARKEYERLLEKKPDDSRLHYNAGTAAYQSRQYELAAKNFNTAVTAPDLDLQQRAFYNLGNTWYRLGEQNEDEQERQASWEQAIKQYDGALKLNAQDKEAKHNRDLVEKKLALLKKQQSQMPQQQQSQKGQKDKQKKKQKSDQKSDGESEGKQDQKEKDGKKDKKKDSKDKKGDEKKDDKDGDRDQQDKKDNQGPPENPEPEPETQQVVLGQMTLDQVKQLLEAQKAEEKALIFQPVNQAKPPTGRKIKDW
jgi:Ca-activated chloride channel family protein